MRAVLPRLVGRTRRLVVVGTWMLLAAALGRLTGRFESVQENEQSSFLPGGSESVEVLEPAYREAADASE